MLDVVGHRIPAITHPCPKRVSFTTGYGQNLVTTCHELNHYPSAEFLNIFEDLREQVVEEVKEKYEMPEEAQNHIRKVRQMNEERS